MSCPSRHGEGVVNATWSVSVRFRPSPWGEKWLRCRGSQHTGRLRETEKQGLAFPMLCCCYFVFSHVTIIHEIVKSQRPSRCPLRQVESTCGTRPRIRSFLWRRRAERGKLSMRGVSSVDQEITLRKIDMVVSINGGSLTWMVYNGKSHCNR